MRGGYIGRHWRGDLPLFVAYWVNGALLGALIRLLCWLVQRPFERFFASADVTTLRAMVIVMLVAAVVLGTWQFVGIWRAASAQVARGRETGWERWAQVTALAAVFLAINGFVDAVFAVAPLFTRD